MSAYFLLTHVNYLAVAGLLMGGLLIVFASRNLVKKLIGLAIFQSAGAILYITLGKVAGGTAPIALDAGSRAGKALAARLDPAYVARVGVDGVIYSNPLPHVLILTAIVVGVATLAVGLAMAVRIRESYGSIEADEIETHDRAAAVAEAVA